MNSDSNPRPSWQPPSLAELQALLPAFEFHALIGRGGMGAVFKATQRSLNRPVAIKVLPGKLMEDSAASFAARFQQEALTMAKLTHPGIVSVFESGEAGGLLYIVMEFVDGTDVARMIASEGRLAPGLAIKLLAQVCDALHYAHEHGVIHRDIKPANLLITRDGTVKIADFGLAKHDDLALLGLTRTNIAIGTPDFLAPEAWAPNMPLDRRSDVYAVGVTLYQMLTGEIPRGFWEMPSACVGTDSRFDAIIERALQPKPEARYQSSAELRRDLERIQTEPRSAEQRSALSEQPVSGPGDARRSASSRPRRVLVTLAVMLAVASAVLWSTRPPAPELQMGLVTSTTDSGRGSLRQAILDSTNGTTITFDTNLSGAIIRLVGGEFMVDKNINIDASELPDGITLDGLGSHRIFRFVRSTNVLTALTIAGGNNSADGTGGGLFNEHGTVTLNRCTLTRNRASGGKLPKSAGGGAAMSYGTLTLNQCTLTGNTSEQGGAIGVSQGGVVNLNHCTVVSNTATADRGGGGVSVQPGSQLVLSNSIVAGNSASVAPDIAGSFKTIGINFTNGDPRLALLGRYGGPTQTMPPLAGSPVIDRCTNGTGFATDQRGAGYVSVMNAYADIGAAEALVPSIPNSSFEAEIYDLYPGNAYHNRLDITGWTVSEPRHVGLNPVKVIPIENTYPYSDNGAIPAGARVIFVGKSPQTNMVSISTTMSGLTPGITYEVGFRANSRASTAAPDPGPTWSLNGGARTPFTVSPPVDRLHAFKGAYYTITGSFVATSNTAPLEVFHLSRVEASLLLDAFTIAIRP